MHDIFKGRKLNSYLIVSHFFFNIISVKYCEIPLDVRNFFSVIKMSQTVGISQVFSKCVVLMESLLTNFYGGIQRLERKMSIVSFPKPKEKVTNFAKIGTWLEFNWTKPATIRHLLLSEHLQYLAPNYFGNFYSFTETVNIWNTGIQY